VSGQAFSGIFQHFRHDQILLPPVLLCVISIQIMAPAEFNPGGNKNEYLTSFDMSGEEKKWQSHFLNFRQNHYHATFDRRVMDVW
jgi:hypothetical protein